MGVKSTGYRNDSGPDSTDREQSPGFERALDEAITRGEADEGPPLALDTIFELLANRRRRAVCRYLYREPDGVRLGDLAEHIAAGENDCPVSMLSSSERKRVYVGLYQCHLPKLDDAGVVRFDSTRKTVVAGPTLPAVSGALEAVEEEVTPDTDSKRGNLARLASLSNSIRSVLS